jgi:hypothetical protein
MRTAARALLVAVAIGSALLAPASALACSAVANPTIAALGPAQVVLLGVTGDRVPAGRLFHVERAWNGQVATSPIVIAFKEGEPVGDCSYPVASGTRLVIAPWREAGGALSADLATLQANPLSEDGKRYLAEAEQLYGAGTVPVDTTPAASPSSDWPVLVVITAFVGGGVAAALVLWRRRQADADA